MEASMNQDTNGLFFEEWSQWLDQLQQPGTLKQLLVIVALGLLSLLAVYVVRKLLLRWFVLGQQHTSMTLGARSYDGLLFPSLWLASVYAASKLMQVPMRYSLFRLALPAILALLVIRSLVKILRLTFKEWRWISVLERTVSWVIWIGVVLWISGLLPLLMQQLDGMQIRIGSIRTNLLSLVFAPITVILALLVSLWLASLIEARLLREATGSTLSLRKIISNALRALLLLVGLLVGLRAVDIDLTAFSVFGGALGVGVGLGLQKLASNYVSGFVVLAERSIRIGDYVKIDGFEGTITDITARYTVLHSWNGVEAILPNDMLVNQRVENRSLSYLRVWHSITITVGYGNDVDLVQSLLVEAALSQPRVLHEPKPLANLENFGVDGLDFRLGFWITDPELGTGLLRSEICKHILRSLDLHQISIPYPQRVLHFAEGQTLPVELQGASEATVKGQGKVV